MSYSNREMDTANLIKEIMALYQKHGWQLHSILLRPETRSAVDASGLDPALIHEAEVDAMWFSRPSHAGRDGWELRLIADQPYALFETFEADETEEQREEVRQEMTARLRDYVSK